MKKMTTILAFVLLLCNTNVFSQISSFQFEGAKHYDNGNTIAYFYIQGISDNNEAYFVQNELRNYQDISRFFIYPYKNNSNRCMIECKSSINENNIFEYINTAINKYDELLSQNNNLREFYLNLYSITDMPKYEDTGNRQNDVLKFKDEFEEWKQQNPEKYSLIKDIRIDTFIQK